MNIGSKITVARQQCGMTQSELADKMCVTRQFPVGRREVHLVKDTTPQPTLTQYCKKTTFG